MLTAVLMAVLMLIIILTALSLLIVSTPIKLEGHFSYPEHEPVQARLSLIGGLTPWINLSPAAPDKSKSTKKEPHRSVKKKAAPARTRRLIKAGPKLVISTLRKIRWDAGRIELDFGFDDPAETGEIFGRLAPLSYSGFGRETFDFLIRPDFNRTHFNINADVSLRLTPIHLVPPIFAFVWKVWGPRP